MAASEKNVELVKTVFERRLQQSDLNRILSELSDSNRSELIAKMGDLLDRVSALAEVYNKVSDTLSLNVLLPRLMAIVTEALHSDRSTLFLNDFDTAELYSRIAEGESVGEIRFPNHLGIAGAIFTKGVSEIIPDAYADPRFNQAVDKKTGYRTRNILCAAIRAKGKVIGVTQVLNKKEGDFTEDDLTFLEALTGQAAAALQNAQLHERVEKAHKEETQLLEVTSSIASELNLDVLLKKIVGVTTEMLSADRSTLFLFDPKTDQLWSRIAEGIGMREIRIPSGAGIAGSCFKSGSVINIPDAYADARFNQAVDKKTGYRTRNILCMPIMKKEGGGPGAGLGVLQVLNKKSGPFAPGDEARLKAFAAQAAIALENAKLFEDVTNERNYNESILKSLSNGVVTLNAERKVVKVNNAAQKMLKLRLEDAAGRPAAEVFAGEGNAWVLQSLDRVVASGKTDVSVDVEIRLATGEVVSSNLSAVPLVDVQGAAIGYMLIIEDITTEKRVKSTMARYMTKEVADKLLQGGEEALGGTSQVASVLFSDIRSFTTISEQLGARETVIMLNAYFTEMIDVIFKYKGILDKYIGDAIMAVFGAPFAGPNDAENAVRAATDMIRALRAHNAKRVAAGIPEIKIGIGISTGELISGNIGSLKRMDYTVIGDTVNLASRLEGTTKFYRAPIIYCESTMEKIRGKMRSREVDRIRVKGKKKPVVIYEGLDHFDEASFPDMDACLAAFDRGIRLYQERRFKESLACFLEGFHANKMDGPTQIYMERCRHYIDAPPEDSWNGVFDMLTK
ncbi:MAG: guanylate cyclase [Elusimicrobia bacterium GWA2_69_24]|nr:MAG: guanylate cyclase [Elusimicrobia bacterium GWA2_69_24]HBL15897.1 adenylate/guanylate cyclase domain-containing protein [Elusimicrobiota bacterium]